MAPVEFIGRYMKRWFDLAIADELHQLAGDTAQGNPRGILARAGRRLIALTGTLMGGYADDSLQLVLSSAPGRSAPAATARQRPVFELLAAAPDRMAGERRNARSSRADALLGHDELLMRFEVTLHWPAGALQRCRFGNSERNVFLAPVNLDAATAILDWVRSALQREPGRCFWQYHFRPSETFNHRDCTGFIPCQVIPLLEEYAKVYRPQLIDKLDHGTLFLNRTGGPICGVQFYLLFGELTGR